MNTSSHCGQKSTVNSIGHKWRGSEQNKLKPDMIPLLYRTRFIPILTRLFSSKYNNNNNHLHNENNDKPTSNFGSRSTLFHIQIPLPTIPSIKSKSLWTRQTFTPKLMAPLSVFRGVFFELKKYISKSLSVLPDLFSSIDRRMEQVEVIDQRGRSCVGISSNTTEAYL